MNANNFLNFIKSRTFVVIIIVLFGLALLVGVFTLGAAVGYRKARFSYAWGENYSRNFGGPREGFMGNFAKDFSGRDLIDAHGTFGQVMKIDGSMLVIKGPDNVEKSVLIKDDTTIQRLRETIKLGDLKTDEYIVVIGRPNDSGQIEAKFIRVMPLPSPSMLMPGPRMR
jgi:hypothetical protein